jgi:hypothetical protein
MADVSEGVEALVGQLRAQAEETVKRLEVSAASGAEFVQWQGRPRQEFDAEVKDLTKRHGEACQDLDRVREAGLKLQELADKLEQKLKELEEATVSTVLLSKDGMA